MRRGGMDGQGPGTDGSAANPRILVTAEGRSLSGTVTPCAADVAGALVSALSAWEMSSLGTCTNSVQSRNVILVASEECGEVCALNKVGNNSDVSKCCVICSASV